MAEEDALRKLLSSGEEDEEEEEEEVQQMVSCSLKKICDINLNSCWNCPDKRVQQFEV